MIEKAHKNNMTVTMCSDICGKDGHGIYGLQYGDRCYCGNQTEQLAQRSVVRGECNTACKGEPMCGGNQVITIYNASTYVGCFNYFPDDTTYFGGKILNLIPKICLDKCRAYRFYGLTQGSRCYCISHIANTSREDVDCYGNGIPCEGAEKCGGSGYIAIWDYKPETVVTDETVEEQEPNSIGTNILRMCITFICGILSVCAAICFAHRYKPQVLKRILNYSNTNEVVVSYERSTNNPDDRLHMGNTVTSPSTIQRNHETSQGPQIEHHYYAGHHGQEYLLIQDDNLLLNECVSFEDMYSSSETNISEATNNRIPKDRSWKTELAYAVSDITVPAISTVTKRT
ncbi:hypothetical protein BSL78_10891 [Apostichopus japonicus]|uniref:WSC domain-containing protein n=1 Tax=Stichopus japonicus TaxID=307972 RepID=A0A2G8KW49_STIJA|nr:hypothetical protein BSL78_10891 [Apostichopus japonicus]